MSRPDPFADVLGKGRGSQPEPPPHCAPAPAPSALERVRAFTSDLVRFDDGRKPDQLAKAHGLALVEGRMERNRGHAPVYFLRDGDGGDGTGGPLVRALVLSYPGRRPGTVRRGVLFTFDSEAS